jgi:acyl-CoA synthetase (AMP-forming)/AMP-acid ligase II
MQISLPESFHFIGRSSPEGVSVAGTEIIARARAFAEALGARGIGRGDRVALWLTRGADQVSAILGCWMVGAAFCILPSYAGRSGSDRARTRVEEVMTTLAPRLLVQGEENALPETVTRTLDTLTLGAGTTGMPPATAAGSAFAARDPDDLAFIQFTSGSTGGPAKGAEVRFGQLQANLDALAARVRMSAADRMVSWAPLYHDMGLMAVLIALRHGAELVLMETEHFVRRPTAWLEAISTWKGTITTAPPTALKLLTHRRATDVDLSSLRYGWIGGETVFPVVLQGFADCYAPAGLKEFVLQPTYGMAETVVGVSCGDPLAPWRLSHEMVSCGRPLEGMEVRVVDADGRPVPDGARGLVHVRGPSVISGYLGLPPFEAGGWYDTGDTGFLEDGHLFVAGRIKDILKRGGESWPSHLVESVAEDSLELRTGRAAAFASFRSDLAKEEIVVLVESRDWTGDQARRVASAIMAELGLQVDVVRAVEGGRLPRTSSGKLMRQMIASLYREGKL